MTKYLAGGHEFDSLIERNRWFRLRELEQQGEIEELVVHPRFEIIPAFTDGAHKQHEVTVFTADFMYRETASRQIVVEDVKPAPTLRINPKTGRTIKRRAPSATRRDFALRWKLAAYQNKHIRFDIVEL